jgi:hypothetical protein
MLLKKGKSIKLTLTPEAIPLIWLLDRLNISTLLRTLIRHQWLADDRPSRQTRIYT